MIRKGVIELTNDSGKLQTALISGLSGEVNTDVEVYQPYGLTSNNPKVSSDGKGSECIIVQAQGVTVCLVGDDRRYRPSSTVEGTVTVYTSDSQQRITLVPGGAVTISNGSSGITLNKDGSIVFTASSIKHNGKEIGSTHIHSGVQGGASNTGGVV